MNSMAISFHCIKLMKLFAWNNVNTTTYENSFWVCITAKYIQSKAIVCVKGNHHYISSFTIVTLIFLLSLGNGYSYFSFKYLKKKRISVFLCFFFLILYFRSYWFLQWYWNLLVFEIRKLCITSWRTLCVVRI